MAAIKGKDTKPELIIRKELFRRGYRYRLHDKNLPGKPDLVLPRYKAVIFVHGCFWHGHGCHLFKWPASRKEFWESKINRNKEKDAEVSQNLTSSGWKVMTVWECILKGREKSTKEEVIKRIVSWLTSDSGNAEIMGAYNGTG